MRSQDIAISVLLHLAFFALIIIASTVRGRAHQFDPDEFANVQLYDNIPAAGPKAAPPQPMVEEKKTVKVPDIPTEIAEQAVIEEDPVKLTSIETPAEIVKKEIKKKERKKEPKKETAKKPTADSGKKKETVVGEEGKDISTSIGSDGVAGSLGVGDFPYDISRVTQIIDRNWQNPVLSQRTLSCVIYFQIDRTGMIKGPAIERSSGNDQYDNHALGAVMRTAELPPLPIAYKYDVLGFHLEFEYRP
ncbi:MAG: energy transducer TonB [Candidatus Zixiibacteriota bacterium]